MAQYIDKSAVIAEIEIRIKEIDEFGTYLSPRGVLTNLLCRFNSVETKDVDLIIHTIIAKCCNWLAMCTELSHDEIEELRNLMLTVKDEQLKAQKGE